MTNPNAATAPSAYLAEGRRVAPEVTRCAQPVHPLGRELVAAWHAAREAGTPLARKDIPSRALLRLMPHLFLLEPLRDGEDWLFRLVGTAITTRFGGDPTGMKTSEFFVPERTAYQAAHYRGTVTADTVMVTEGSIVGIEREFLHCEFCHLSLRPSAPGMNWLLGGVFVFPVT